MTVGRRCLLGDEEGEEVVEKALLVVEPPIEEGNEIICCVLGNLLLPRKIEIIIGGDKDSLCIQPN